MLSRNECMSAYMRASTGTAYPGMTTKFIVNREADCYLVVSCFRVAYTLHNSMSIRICFSISHWYTGAMVLSMLNFFYPIEVVSLTLTQVELACRRLQ